MDLQCFEISLGRGCFMSLLRPQISRKHSIVPHNKYIKEQKTDLPSQTYIEWLAFLEIKGGKGVKVTGSGFLGSDFQESSFRLPKTEKHVVFQPLCFHVRSCMSLLGS